MTDKEDKVDQITYDTKMEELSEKEKNFLWKDRIYLVKQEDLQFPLYSREHPII